MTTYMTKLDHFENIKRRHNIDSGWLIDCKICSLNGFIIHIRLQMLVDSYNIFLFDSRGLHNKWPMSFCYKWLGTDVSVGL